MYAIVFVERSRLRRQTRRVADKNGVSHRRRRRRLRSRRAFIVTLPFSAATANLLA